jgi:3-hydroxyisobutyrate dehydrogenase-like beta-hydroxyacid dehydrogenase
MPDVGFIGLGAHGPPRGPVTRLPDAAASEKLTLLVGADRAELEKARPFLEPIGSTIRHFGVVGSAVSRRNGAPS